MKSVDEDVYLKLKQAEDNAEIKKSSLNKTKRALRPFCFCV